VNNSGNGTITIFQQNDFVGSTTYPTATLDVTNWNVTVRGWTATITGWLHDLGTGGSSGGGATSNSESTFGSSVTSVSRGPNNLDVFWSGQDGSLNSVWWQAGGSWQTSAFSRPAGSTVAGGTVTVISRTTGHIDVFWVDKTGTIQTAYWDVSSNCAGNNPLGAVLGNSTAGRRKYVVGSVLWLGYPFHPHFKWSCWEWWMLCHVRVALMR